MNKYWKLIVGAVAFVAFMVVVSMVYKNLSQEYKPQQNLVTQKGSETEDNQVLQEGPEEADNPAAESTDDKDLSVGVTDGETVAEAGQGAGEENQSAVGDEQDTGDDGSQSGTNAGGAQDTNGDMSGNTSNERTDDTENLAPNFTVETAEGEEVSLHDFFGKPIVLNFWASWCGPCKMELPDFQDAFEKYEGEVEFVMVNMTDGMQETKEIAMEFMEGEGYTLPVYYDTAQDAAYTYTVYSLPTTFFISADGEPVAYAQGMIDAETLETGISMIYP